MATATDIEFAIVILWVIILLIKYKNKYREIMKDSKPPKVNKRFNNKRLFSGKKQSRQEREEHNPHMQYVRAKSENKILEKVLN